MQMCPPLCRSALRYADAPSVMQMRLLFPGPTSLARVHFSCPGPLLLLGTTSARAARDAKDWKELGRSRGSSAFACFHLLSSAVHLRFICCRSTADPLQIRRRSVVDPLYIRCRCTVDPLQIRCGIVQAEKHKRGVQGGPRCAAGAPQIRICEFLGGPAKPRGGFKGARGAPQARRKSAYANS